MAVPRTAVIVGVLVGISFLFLIIGTSTDHWVRVEPYYEDFMWKGCVRRGPTFNRLGCERITYRFSEDDDGAVILLLQTFAVNASLVGKPYDLIYGGLWQGCKEKGDSKHCKGVDLSFGPRTRGNWYVAVKALMVLAILAYVFAIVAMVFVFWRELKLWFVSVVLTIPFVMAIIGLFLYTANSNVSVRYRNYYGWSYYLSCFAAIFTYVVMMMCCILSCVKIGSQKYSRY